MEEAIRARQTCRARCRMKQDVQAYVQLPERRGSEGKTLKKSGPAS